MAVPRSRHSVFTRLVTSQLITILITLLIAAAVFGYLMHKYFFGVSEWELAEKANRMRDIVHEHLDNDDITSLRETIYTLSRSSDFDLWILDDRGEILVGSRLADEDPSLTLDSLEIEHSLMGNIVTKKVSGPSYQNLLIVFPLFPAHGAPGGNEQPAEGALVIRAPLGAVGSTVNHALRLVVYSALIAVLIVVVPIYVQSQQFSRPLRQLRDAALGIANGEFRQVVMPPHSLEVEQLAAALNYAAAETERTLQKQLELDSLRKEFFANASHEFRAPLTSIKGFLEIIADRTNLDENETRQYVEIMLKDVHYLERLVGDLFDLSRLELGKLALNKISVAVGELVSQVVGSMQAKAAGKGVKLRKDISRGIVAIEADGDRLYQVMVNLVENALQHTPPGGTVRVVCKQEGASIVLQVIDSGKGIPEHLIPRIWERFYKADGARTRKKEGSGLGLSIVKEIVTAHGGEVKAASKLGKGTIFQVKLPVNGC